MTVSEEYKVLIMMSTYNGEKYLPQMLDSIKAQQGCKIHLLVRDDGSKDRTLEILEQYSKKMELEYYCGENLKSAGSFYDLLIKAPLDYEYYGFSDQDDYWEDDKIISAVKKLDELKTKKPAMYYSGQKIVNEKLELLYYHDLNYKKNVYGSFLFNPVAGCTVVINKELLKYAKMNEKAKPAMHDSYLFRLCAAIGGQFVVDSRGKILYRQHGNNVVGLNNTLPDKLKLFREHFNSSAVRDEAIQIYEVYEEYITDTWREFISNIIKMKNSFALRFKMLFFKNIKLGSIKVRLTYIFKVLLNKF